MEKVEAGTILKVKTGKYDANHAKENGNYQFFTCALVPFWTDTYSFDDEVIILPGNGANVGEVLYYKGKLEAYQRTYILYEINANVRYLYYYFKKYWIRQITKKQVGSATNYIKMDDILSFEIPLPNLATQQRIAAILDQAEAIIQNNRAIVQKYDALTQSLFLDMFGDPVKNEKGWEVVNFEQVLSLKRGYDLPVQERNENGNIPVFGSNGILGFHNISKRNEPCLVTGRSGSIGFVHKVDVPCWPLNTTLYSYLTNNNNIVYLEYLLRNFKIERFSHGAGVPTLDRKLVHKENIINVNITLQNQFAERVAVIEAQKQQAQLALAKSEELFASLLQKAFKGEL